MQTLAEIPRALGISDDAIQNALISTINDPSASNPFADLLVDIGAKNAHHVQMLASLVNGNSPEPIYRSSGLKRDLPPDLSIGPSKRLHI